MAHRVDLHHLPFVPAGPDAAPDAEAARARRRRAPAARWGPRRGLSEVRGRRACGDGALLLLCVLLMVATFAGAVGLVILAT